MMSMKYVNGWWFQVDSESGFVGKPGVVTEGGGLFTATLRLRFKLKRNHFEHQRVTVQCTAEILGKYYESGKLEFRGIGLGEKALGISGRANKGMIQLHFTSNKNNQINLTFCNCIFYFQECMSNQIWLLFKSLCWSASHTPSSTKKQGLESTSAQKFQHQTRPSDNKKQVVECTLHSSSQTVCLYNPEAKN